MLNKPFYFFLKLLFTPFYTGFFQGLFSFNIGKYPLYKQIQYLHFRINRKLNFKTNTYKLKPDSKVSFFLKFQPNTDFHRHSLYAAGAYERDITAHIIDAAPKQDIFLDVGACIGYYTILAASINPFLQIFSFEPDPLSFTELECNIDLNNCSNIKAFNFAAGSERGDKLLYKGLFPEQNSLIRNKEKKVETLLVKTEKIDGILSFTQKNILIKIDTEGYEFEVVKGMQELIKNNNCTLIFEFNPSLYNLLDKNGAFDFLTYLRNEKFTLFETLSEKKLSEIVDLTFFITQLKQLHIHILAKKM
ncbi:MAG: FkbM family methyltransferase [Bacteroidales bacterium]|nr:FkbM family methyltransferase [Bacteroidales bacterium]